MVLLDLDGERAAAVARERGGEKATSRAADARDEDGLARLLDDVDLLINTASYRVNLNAMRACLAAGCAYLDLGGLYWMTGRQLELADEFRRAGLLALLGIGSSPGKTNLMAQRAIERTRRRARRGRADRGRRRWAGSGCGGRRPAAAPVRTADAARRADAVADRAPRGPADRARAATTGRGGRFRRADRPRGHDLHAALRAADVRRQLRLPVARASGCRSPRPCSAGCGSSSGCLPTMSPPPLARRRRRRTRRCRCISSRPRPSPAWPSPCVPRRNRISGLAARSSRPRLRPRPRFGCSRGEARRRRGAAARAMHRPGRDVRRARVAWLFVLGNRTRIGFSAAGSDSGPAPSR